MNKNTQIQTINGNESNTIQKKSKKNKFNKFFTTVSAVMIASSIALSPMTLRADDTDKKEKKNHTTEEVIELIDKKIEENNKIIEKNNKDIEQNNKDIEQSKKKIEENKKKMEIEKKKLEEARNKLKTKCESMGNNIQLAEKYCTENECTKEQKEILKKSKNTYNEECVRFVAKSE